MRSYMQGFLAQHPALRRSLATLLILVGAAVLIQDSRAPVVTDGALYFGTELPDDRTRSSVTLTGREYVQTSTPASRSFWWVFTLTPRAGAPTVLHLTVDDCAQQMRINGRAVELSTLVPDAFRCNTVNGFYFDFTPYLKEGTNEIAILINDFGGGYKVAYALDEVGEESREQAILALTLLICVLFWRGGLWLPRSVPLPWPRLFTAMIATAVALYCWRFLLVAPGDNSHDYSGHLEYIRYLASHFWRPAPDACLECYQPPIYYALGAAFYRLGEWLGLRESANMLKVLGLLIYLAFINISLRHVARLSLKPAVTALGFGLFLFWPLAFIKSTDINTDVLTAAAILLSFYFTLDWYEYPHPRHAAKALAVAAFAMLVKSNGVAAFAIFGTAVLLALWERRIGWREIVRPRYVLPFLLFGLIGISNVVYLYSLILETGATRSAMVYNSMDSHPDLWFADDRPSYYLTFPLGVFLDHPFMNTGADIAGRKYFWNALLKTALFGEWPWGAPALAVAMNTLFLAMIGYAFLTLLRHPTAETRLHLWLLGLLLAMLMAFRISQPAACNQDIRYIYAAVPLFCLLYAQAIQRYFDRHHPLTAGVGMLMGTIFIGLSLSHFLIHYH